jgi:HSP20 family molecular chaperone IbpA
LPEGVDPKDIKATYSNLILEVRIPNPEKVEKTPTKVSVTRK